MLIRCPLPRQARSRSYPDPSVEILIGVGATAEAILSTSAMGLYSGREQGFPRILERDEAADCLVRAQLHGQRARLGRREVRSGMIHPPPFGRQRFVPLRVSSNTGQLRSHPRLESRDIGLGSKRTLSVTPSGEPRSHSRSLALTGRAVEAESSRTCSSASSIVIPLSPRPSECAKPALVEGERKGLGITKQPCSCRAQYGARSSFRSRAMLTRDYRFAARFSRPCI